MISIFLAALLSSSAEAKALTAQAPVAVPGGPGKFDFMNVDNKDRLAFACQPGASSLVVINLDSGEVKSVPLGAACNGVSADSAAQKLYAAGPGKTLVQIDMTTWKKSGSLALDGPGDSVMYDNETNRVYVDNDDGTNLWVVDPATLRIVATVPIKEAPEVMVLDTKRHKIFQNIKSTNSLQVIDTESNAVVAEYKLGDLTSPHGLAIDKKAGKLFSVGKNGKLVILDADSGKILSTVDVVKNSDQIAYDTKLKRLYIPGGGQIQTVQITDDGAQILDSEPAPAGCHSVTIDPKTHNVWVAYADTSSGFVMKYVAAAPGGAE